MKSTRKAKPSLSVDYWHGRTGYKTLMRIDLFNLPAVNLEWIAHRLARTYRNVGTSPYTVLDHTLAVYNMLPQGTSGALRLYVLLHDAAEAFIGDVQSPIKKLIPAIGKVEAKIHRQLLKLYWPGEVPSAPHLKLLHDLCKVYDTKSYELEQRLQLGETPVNAVEEFLDCYAKTVKLIEEEAAASPPEENK